MRREMKKAVIAMILSAQLPPLSEKQREYAYRHCFEDNCAVRKGDVVHCLECGGSFETDNPRGSLNEVLMGYVCPHCGRKLRVVQSRTRQAKGEFVETFQIITSIKEVAVVRTWYLWKRTQIDTPAEFSMEEAHQIFISPKWGEVIVGRVRRPMSYYVDKWDYTKPMRVRKGYDYYDPFHIRATVVYPQVRLPKVVRRNGWCKGLLDFIPSQTIRRLLNDPCYETLAKTGRFDIWEHFTAFQINELWPQIKMMIRHNYHADDYTLWRDTVDMADKNGFDTHSPKYVLPADLKAMHDFLDKKDKERLRREELEELKKKDAEYKETFGVMLAVRFKEGDISVRPLQDATEFTEEGEKMHHCVATYFGHKDSLILSARKDGERLATIELDTKTFKIVQCRAVCNKKPERYDEICRIVKAHRKEFVEAKRKQRLILRAARKEAAVC